ncbi:anti-repressor SinI family protein [Alkalibacillus haloalkaliphilus]|nr:anti-repressor SinI family protein [Alkalibacillus haloalkaliphilus]
MRTLAMEVRLIKGLDNEWVQLMKEAREAGISKDEIREFLTTSKVTE